MVYDLIYNSNAIEGNKIEKEIVKKIYENIEEFIQKNGYLYHEDNYSFYKMFKNCYNGRQKEIMNEQLEDFKESFNHALALKYFFKILYIKDLSYILAEDVIKHLHLILRQNTKDVALKYNIGTYKNFNNSIANKKTCKKENVKGEMKKLLKKFLEIKNKQLEDIFDFHIKFEAIHPFCDGNGRIGRLLMYIMGLKVIGEQIIINVDNRETYYLLFNPLTTKKELQIIEECLLTGKEKRVEKIKKRILTIEIADFLKQVNLDLNN